MSNSDSSVILLTDAESDSDLESLVDTVFLKVQRKLLKKKPKTNHSKACNKNIATTTTPGVKVGRTRRFSTRSQTKEKQEENKTDSLSESNDIEDVNVPFFIDTKPSKISATQNAVNSISTNGDCDLVEQVASPDSESGESDSDSESEIIGNSTLNNNAQRHKGGNLKKKQNREMELSSSLQTGLDPSDLYINVNSLKQNKAGLKTVEGLEKNMSQLLRSRDDEIMKKSVLTPEFEKQDRCLPYSESQRKLKQDRRKERAKTKGNNWFNMPATELTDERKNDLKILQMRHALDPKRFYRANDMRAAPKYFQFGTVLESKADFYSSRIPKKQRKSTLVDELMADADFRKFNKRKYSEIQEAKRTGSGPYQKLRFPKKKKKTRN